MVFALYHSNSAIKRSMSTWTWWMQTDSRKSSQAVIATDKRGYPHNIFLISPQKHMLWYSLEAPQWSASNEYPQHMFSWRNKKDISIFRMKKAPYLLLWSLYVCHDVENVFVTRKPIGNWHLYMFYGEIRKLFKWVPFLAYLYESTGGALAVTTVSASALV